MLLSTLIACYSLKLCYLALLVMLSTASEISLILRLNFFLIDHALETIYDPSWKNFNIQFTYCDLQARLPKKATDMRDHTINIRHT